jgi:scyllo-inositol 2-dehydrogenase (NADP+)
MSIVPHTLKVGIVGYGFAAATFHAPLLLTVSELELVAISSRHPAKIRASIGYALG